MSFRSSIFVEIPKVVSGVLSSWVILLIKSVLMSLTFFCLINAFIAITKSVIKVRIETNDRNAARHGFNENHPKTFRAGRQDKYRRVKILSFDIWERVMKVDVFQMKKKKL